MLSLAPFWLAGAAIIALMSLWARANRRSGWRRARPGADLPSLRELLELDEEVREGSEQASLPVVLPARSQPPPGSPDSADLVALQVALSRPASLQENPPQEPHPQTTKTQVAAS